MASCASGRRSIPGGRGRIWSSSRCRPHRKARVCCGAASPFAEYSPLRLRIAERRLGCAEGWRSGGSHCCPCHWGLHFVEQLASFVQRPRRRQDHRWHSNVAEPALTCCAFGCKFEDGNTAEVGLRGTKGINLCNNSNGYNGWGRLDHLCESKCPGQDQCRSLGCILSIRRAHWDWFVYF